jgi:hypothetical protein
LDNFNELSRGLISSQESVGPMHYFLSPDIIQFLMDHQRGCNVSKFIHLTISNVRLKSDGAHSWPTGRKGKQSLRRYIYLNLKVRAIWMREDMYV